MAWGLRALATTRAQMTLNFTLSWNSELQTADLQWSELRFQPSSCQ